MDLEKILIDIEKYKKLIDLLQNNQLNQNLIKPQLLKLKYNMTETIEQKCLAKGVKLTEQRKIIAKVMGQSKQLYGDPSRC